jgi:hypothetical protein
LWKRLDCVRCRQPEIRLLQMSLKADQEIGEKDNVDASRSCKR